MFKKSTFGNFSLEEFEADDDNGQYDADTEVSDETPFADDDIEIASAADVVEDAMDQIAEVGESLEEIFTCVEATMANGGMTQGEAVFANLAIEKACGRWLRVSPQPSLESYDQAGGRLANTQYSLESIADSIKAIWAKIVRVVKAWWAKAVAFREKHLSIAGITAKQAKSLAAKADKHTGKIDKSTVTIGVNTYRNLLLNSSPDHIADGLKDITTVIEKLGAGSAIADYVEISTKALEGVDLSTAEKVETFYTKIKNRDLGAEAIATKFKRAAVVKLIEGVKAPYESKDNVHYLVSDSHLIGDKIVVARFGANSDKLITSINCSLHDANPNAKFSKDSYNMKALGPSEISALLEHVADAADAVRKSKTDVSSRNKLIQEILKAGEHCVKELEGSDIAATNKPALKFVKAYVYGVQSVASTVMQPNADLERQALASARAAYSYAAICYSNLKK